MPTVANAYYTQSQIEQANGFKTPMEELPFPLAANQTIAQGTVVGIVTSANASDVQTLTATATLTAGTFNIVFVSGGAVSQTAALGFGATAAQVLAALIALPAIGTGGVTVTGGPISAVGTPIVITFAGKLANQPQNLVTLVQNLTGGTIGAVHTTVGVQNGAVAAYNSGNSDGSQVPKGVAAFAGASDATGLITFGTLPGGSPQNGPSGQRALPIIVKGFLNCADLIGLDANALTAGRFGLVWGTTSTGVVDLY